jgi:hypothetical protein
MLDNSNAFTTKLQITLRQVTPGYPKNCSCLICSGALFKQLMKTTVTLWRYLSNWPSSCSNDYESN